MANMRALHQSRHDPKSSSRLAAFGAALMLEIRLLAAWVLSPLKRNLEWLLRFGISPTARTVLEMRRRRAQAEAAPPRDTR